ncbi:FGGY family carbohydrate kinase [Aliifodinibius sp. S!AR15-10]|uniref:xylulokinase n=1 Tax=Aliifodinibius sp. S!AR15-10 TaxID=2950437 RepID=UPI00285CBFB4|nr:FGGY family carbohydrate kinase [Aliifodinibius sp. S!AR15-10]MDR8390930.1 FGGY family carbohydrate kinase [Aliifodinibius sp. S!AR15-10]
MYLLGYDVGSSSIKASLIEADGGKLISSATSPSKELEISAPEPGWAEQDPETWWTHVVKATKQIVSESGINTSNIEAIGISYQMHGLVLVDENNKSLRPSIIWCDGRAVDIGQQAFEELGEDYCLEHFLNSPGNFTASKLKWVKENEPDVYKKTSKFMLPGDYIAMKMSGDIATTTSGLSEGIFWDFKSNGLADQVLEHYGLSKDLVPEVHPNMAEHGELSAAAAEELGLSKGIKISYRAGDQPNNALSLNVLNPGEVASTAGTSGVIYGVTDKPLHDDQSRVNTFVHVNHTKDNPSYGVLLCVNGTGIQYSWLRNTLLNGTSYSYDDMNEMAAKVPIGAEGISVLPFGNGPERPLANKDLGGRINGIQFNRHNTGHVIRAAQEGIAFALNYGLQIMKEMGMEIETVRVGHTNMFLSPVFAEAFTNVTGKVVEMYNTDGSIGAAIGAGIGAGIYKERSNAFAGLKKVKTQAPESELVNAYSDAYEHWHNELEKAL